MLEDAASLREPLIERGAELVALVSGGLLVAALGARWTLPLAGALPVVAATYATYAALRRARPAARRVTSSPTATTRLRPLRLASYSAESAERKSLS